MTRKKKRILKRILIAKAIKFTVNGLFVAGVFTLLGSLGAVEIEKIQYGAFIIHSVLGLALMLFSRYAHYKIYEEDTDDERHC